MRKRSRSSLDGIRKSIMENPGLKAGGYARMLGHDNKTVLRALPQLEQRGDLLVEDRDQSFYSDDGDFFSKNIKKKASELGAEAVLLTEDELQEIPSQKKERSFYCVGKPLLLGKLNSAVSVGKEHGHKCPCVKTAPRPPFLHLINTCATRRCKKGANWA